MRNRPHLSRLGSTGSVMIPDDRSSRSRMSFRFNVEPDFGLFEHPGGGIALEVTKLDGGEGGRAALALVADLAGVAGGRNTGMSATSSLGQILSAYHRTILQALSVEHVLWVEIDSLGCFDLVRPHFRNEAVTVEWQPLLSGWHAGRTLADFLGLFGSVGDEIFRNLLAEAPRPS